MRSQEKDFEGFATDVGRRDEIVHGFAAPADAEESEKAEFSSGERKSLSPGEAIDVVNNEIRNQNERSPWTQRENGAPDRLRTDPGNVPAEEREAEREKEEFPEKTHSGLRLGGGGLSRTRRLNAECGDPEKVAADGGEPEEDFREVNQGEKENEDGEIAIG